MRKSGKEESKLVFLYSPIKNMWHFLADFFSYAVFDLLFGGTVHFVSSAQSGFGLFLRVLLVIAILGLLLGLIVGLVFLLDPGVRR